MEEGQVLTLKEAARYVRVNEKTLRELAKSGRVPSHKVGREWRFLRNALDKWLCGDGMATNDTPVVSEPAVTSYRFSAAKELAGNGTAGFGDTAFTRNRGEPVHRWVPWIAGFSASFVAETIERELAARERLLVLDPFAGVGTTLVEAVKRCCDTVGFEINPFAALACQVKVESLWRDPREVREAAERIASEVTTRQRAQGAETRSTPPPGFRTRDAFLSPNVERQVLAAKDVIAEEKNPWLRRIMQVALGAVLVGVSNYSYEPSLGRRVAAGKSLILDADLALILSEKLLCMASDIEALQAARPRDGRRPSARVLCESFLTGALDHLNPGSVGLLITSPPYLNNYHYVRNTRPQMFWLDLAAEPADLRGLETASFGKFWQTVRTDDAIPLDFSCLELEQKLAELRSTNADRGPYGGPGWANYAATYFNDCARFCTVTARVMRPGGLAVVVIGNNILQGVEFRTDRFFAEIAERAGFEVQGLHEVRRKRTGSSIVNSSVRAGVMKTRTELYETAVELRLRTSTTGPDQR